MKPDFNFIAPFYDALSFVVYGNNLKRAKRAFIHQLADGSRLLLMGGGTGNILNSIFKLKPEIWIDFVEPAEAMIAIAKKHVKPEFAGRVNFVCGDEHSIPEGKMYDAATSFFVLDLFPQPDALKFLNRVISHVKPEGIFLFADFHYTKSAFHRWLIQFMYRFFRVVSKVPATKLPDYQLLFDEVKLKTRAEKKFLGGLIQSKVMGLGEL